MKNPRNNYITVAKALGIIMMVIGHSGCPTILGNFIYFFHMPLFFVCSGFFFNEIFEGALLKSFYIKRIKGLYIPYH
jgi:fucose 4-O-acetylase-like acetyltransferase